VAARKQTRATKKSEPSEPMSSKAPLDSFLSEKRHPLEGDIQWLRPVVLGLDASIREEIKWNSLSFRNEHDFFATVNLRSTESLELILYTGVKKKATAETGVIVDDPRGLIVKWPAKDRCVASLGSGDALRSQQKAIAELLKTWLQFVR